MSTGLRTQVNKWLKFGQSILFPPSCLLCRKDCEAETLLCPACLPATAQACTGRRCTRCALLLPALGQALCGECLKQHPSFCRTVVARPYTPPWSNLILRFKDHGNLAAGRYLSSLLAEAVSATSARADLLVPVPMHPRRLRQRGYNQSLEICRDLARLLALPMAKGLIRCTRLHDSQKTLGRHARLRNLAGCFTLKDGAGPLLEGRTVALVDDVMTTGATATVLSKLLLSGGALGVSIWALARTDRH